MRLLNLRAQIALAYQLRISHCASACRSCLQGTVNPSISIQKLPGSFFSVQYAAPAQVIHVRDGPGPFELKHAWCKTKCMCLRR